MLRHSKIVLGGEPSHTAIIERDGISYTYSELEDKVKQFTSALHVLQPDHVMVNCSSGFIGTAAVLAAIEADAHIAVCHMEAEEIEYHAKNSIFKTDLVISDFRIDKHVLTLTPDGINQVPQLVINELGGNGAMSYLSHRVNSMFNNHHVLPEVPTSKLSSLFINFHRGITTYGFKYSGLTHRAVMDGIKKAYRLEFSKNVLFAEKFELLQDIVNGVLAPLANGCTVKFASTETPEATYHTMRAGSNTTLYTHADTLQTIFNLIRDNSWYIKLLKSRLKGLSDYFVGREFRNTVGVFNRIFVTGKIKEYKIFNSLKPLMGTATLYTMCEVASFISINNPKKFAKNYSVGTVQEENVTIVKGRNTDYGIVMLYTDDIAVTTHEASFDETFVHSEPGKINTRDVGFLQNGELHLIDKDNFVFESVSGTRIDTTIVEKIIKRKEFISDTLIVHDRGGLLAFVSLDIEEARRKNLRLRDADDICMRIEDEINNKVFNGEPVVRIAIYVLPDGLNRQKCKFLSRAD